MDIETVVILTDALKEYFNNELEFQQFCDLYDVHVELYGWNAVGVDASRIDYSKMAQKLIENRVGFWVGFWGQIFFLGILQISICKK